MGIMEKTESRLDKLEKEILKYKKTTIIALIFSIVCGGGGIFGVVVWASSLPKQEKEIAKLEKETDLMKLTAIKDSIQITSMQMEEINKRHKSELESITRQLDLYKELKNDKQVKALTKILIKKEEQYQLLITVVRDMCQTLAKQTGSNEQWIGKYITRMNELKGQSENNIANLKSVN